MEERQRIFIESMAKMAKAVPEYEEPLKAITKSYIINEGIKDFAGKMKDRVSGGMQKVKDYVTKPVDMSTPVQKPAVLKPLDQNELEHMKKLNATRQSDLMLFQNDLKSLLFHLNQYGDEAYFNYVMKPSWDETLKIGARIDNMRKRANANNQLMEAVNRAMQFVAVLESVASLGYEELAKNVYSVYNITEASMGTPTELLISTSLYDAQSLMEMVKSPARKAEEADANRRLETITMPNIERFIRKHGRSSWDAFQQHPSYKIAMQRAANIRKGLPYGSR